MKTIVARFTEMKKAPGEIIEVDGEEVNVNKVEAALKSVGVQLRDTQGQFRDLDDVFLELASKWDSLDVMSQRYVATMAAGSRQQSRFIAMMSNYQRTMELTGYATNSAGASQKQFEKTMDSLTSKLNRLHDAWEQYVTGIANQSIIKGVVDLLTSLLETVNKVTDALDPLHTGWSKILAAFLGFKAAKGVVNGVLKGIGTQLGTRKPNQTTVPGGEPTKTGLDEKQGTVDGTKYGKGFWSAFQKMQAQKQPGAMPLNEKTKATKEAMKAQGMSTKKFTLTGKDTQAAKILKEQSKEYSKQSAALKNLNSEYTKYSGTLQSTNKSNAAFRDSTKATRANLIAMETEYQKMEGVSEKDVAASKARVAALQSEENTIGRNTGAKKLNASAEEMSTFAKETNIGATEAEASAKKANTAATVLEGEALDVENIKQQALNMTKGQALLGLFSLNREKRLAAAVTLGLASTEEVETMAKKGATGAQTAFNAALYACPIMWIVAAVVALIAALAILVIWQHKAAETAEKENKAKLEGVKKATEEATEAAKEAKEAYDDLLENKNTYNQLQKELRTLVEGSDEYNKKLKETKELIDDVVENNPEIAKYVTYDSNGKPFISPEGWALAEKTKKEKAYQTKLAKGITDVNSAYETYLNTISGDEYYLSRENLKFKNGKNASDQLDYDNIHYKPEDGAGLSTEYYKQVGRYRISKDITTEKTDKNTIKVGKYYMSEAAYNDLSQLVGQVNDVGQYNAYGKNDTGMSTKNYNIVRWNNKLTGAEENNRSGTSGGISSFGISMTIDDSSLETAVDQVFEQGQQAFDTFSEKVKHTYSSALMDGISNLEEVSPSQANAFAKYYTQRLIDSGEAKQTIEDFGDVYKSYFEKGEKELESAYEAKFGKFEPEEVGLDTNSEEYKTEKQSYMAARLAGRESFSKQVEADVKVYTNLMSNHTKAFTNMLTILSKDFSEIDDDKDKLIGALLDTANAADFLTGEYGTVAKEMNINSSELQEAWTAARQQLQQDMASGVKLFNSDKVTSVKIAGTTNSSSQTADIDYTKILQERIGVKALVNFGYLNNAWQDQVKKLNSTIYGVGNDYIKFNTDNLLSSIFNTDLLKGPKEAEETYKKLSEINFSNPIKAAKTIDDLSKSTNENYAELRNTTVEITSLTRQVQYTWKSIDKDTMSDLFEDGAATTEEIKELAKTLPDLADLLDLNSISASTLAKYFNEVKSGMLDIETTSANFIKALDKINEAQNLITDSMDYINNFKASTSQQTITDSLSEWRDSMEQSLERGQYGDQNLQDYAKAILGIDNWNKYYAEFNGNLQKVEELAFSKISLWKDNFYDLWKDFAGKSSTVSLGSSNEIVFDLSNITSIDELRQQLMDTYDFSEEMADAAIADAQTYSSELSAALKQLSIGDSIQSLLEGGVENAEKKTINVSKAELEILASEAGMTFTDFVKSINNTLDGWAVDYSEFLDENGQLTEDKIKEYTQRVKSELVDPNAKATEKMSGVDEQVTSFSLDKMYSEMLSKGMKPDQIKTQMQSILKDATKDMATGNNKVFYYFKDGILNAYTGALTDKTKIAESLGVSADLIYDSIDSATAGGMLDGLQDEKVRAQKDLDALDTLESTAKAVFLGYKLGMMDTKDVNSEVSNDLYDKIDGALTSALKGKRDELNSILNSSSELDVGNFSSEYNENKLGQYWAYITKISREGWPDKNNGGSDWTNDYDEYYNALKKIEGLERKRTELEKQQSRLIKQRYLDEEKIKANKKAQVDLLKQQARINSDLANTAAAYLRGDSNGDVWFDEATGTIQTNPNAAYYNEKQKKIFDKQLSLMEKNYETWKEANDNLEDIYDAIDELTKIAEFSIEDLTNNIDKAITVLDNTLSNFERVITRSERWDSGISGENLKKLYEQEAQTYVDKYNQLTAKKAINEQKFNGQIYSDYGKYIDVNWDTKEVQKSALYYTITDPDIKEKVDDFYDETVSLAESVIDIDNQQEDIKDSVYDLKKNLLDKALEFQEKVYDAVVKLREDEIETLDTINNSIKDAASELISSIQKNIQKIRQDRNNKKTEEELTKLQNRLTYLQMDTSGGNQKEILDLQKQLDDKEQSYTDSLIDQKISELQDQNTEAEKQRKKQIEILQAQLDLSKENGTIWKNVDNAIKTGFDSSGKIQRGSDLYNMLASLDEVTKKNSAQFERWFGDLSNLASAYNASLTADLNVDGKMSNQVSNANDIFGENSKYIQTLKNQLEEMNRDGNFNHLVWYDQENEKIRYKYNITYFDNEQERLAYDRKVAEYKDLAQMLANARAFYKINKNASFISAFNRMYGYDTGGIADYTGLAWLDGTPSSPELVLNKRDTENFIQLKDILASIMNNTSTGTTTKGDYYFEINIDVDKITNDYDVDKMVDRIKQQITNSAGYRNVNTINMIR